MAWTKYQISIAILMVITGSINTIATKWADRTYSKGIDGTSRKFNHPFLQAASMFLGELTCLGAYYAMRFYYRKKDYTEEQFPPSISGSRAFNPFIFLPPALCDMTATSLMYIGLNLTYASSFQMLRGALIFFTGLLSVTFLRRQLKAYQWIGMMTVMTGLAIVGLSDFLFGTNGNDHGVNGIITGDLLIIIAQIITATQMVIEEKFVSGYNVAPLQAVGYEGMFGFAILSFLLIPMYFIPGGDMIFKNPNGQLEDALDGFVQIWNSYEVLLGVLGTIISISFFNFAGISVTKQISATTRTVLDSIRTIVIWVFSLALQWQTFSYVQLIGFTVLIFGMFLYYGIIRSLLIRSGILKADISEVANENRPIIDDESGVFAPNDDNDDADDSKRR